MFSSIKSLFAAAALLAVLPSSFAQTPAPTATGTAAAEQARIQNCAISIETAGFMYEYNYDVSDTRQYSQVYTYSYEACKDVPAASVRLTNYGGDGSSVSCTHGSMATTAGTEGQDFSLVLRMGVRPTFFVREDIFTVYAVDARTSAVSSTAAATSTAPPATITSAPATASQLAQRRRRAVETGEVVLNAGMICDAGETACPMRDSRKRSFSRCIDTANELYACGGCPGAAGAQDCSELKGVVDVQCVQGTCQINQCDRSHKLSSDGKTCVRKDSVAKRSFW